MSLNTSEILIKVPHRISGFFQIVDEINGVKIGNPEKIGSRGAGFCITAFGYTKISIQDIETSKENKVQILINGQEQTKNAKTTNYIFLYLKEFFKKKVKMRIDHNFDLPVGCGYGASGSGAIGTALGNNFLILLVYISQRGCIHPGECKHSLEVNKIRECLKRNHAPPFDKVVTKAS